jgi:hypothetical protein
MPILKQRSKVKDRVHAVRIISSCGSFTYESMSITISIKNWHAYIHFKWNFKCMTCMHSLTDNANIKHCNDELK